MIDWLISVFYYVVPFVFILGVLVFVHELGHFLVARWCGVYVTDFSIGFGKELWARVDKHGTRWKVCAIPLGGYVKMLGNEDVASATDDISDLSEEEKVKSFAYQPAYKKLFISIAGPLSNYLFAILIFASVYIFIGKFIIPAQIGEVISGSAAEEAGLQEGDLVLSLDGKKIRDFNELREVTSILGESPVDIEVDRSGNIEHLTLTLKPISIADEEGNIRQQKMLGVRSVGMVDISPERMGVVAAFSEASYESWRITVLTLEGLWQIVTGKKSGEDVGGVIRIAEMSGDIFKTHSIANFIVFMALLSINLGLINLLPIPLLDGGHVVVYTVEIISRREVGEKTKEYLARFGLGIIVFLMLFATWNDFSRLFSRWFS